MGEFFGKRVTKIPFNHQKQLSVNSNQFLNEINMTMPLRMIRILSIILISIAAQTFAGTIHGKILHAHDKMPLEAVNIMVKPSSRGAVSRPDGSFKLILAAGRYTVSFQHIGFVRHEIVVDVTEQDKVDVQIHLEPTRLSLHEEVTVTAERDDRAVFLSPMAVTTVSRQEMLRQWPRSTPEALFGTQGVWLQKTNHGGGSPFLRGLTGNQVLMLIDGIRLNNATFRYGPNQYLNTIDPNMIDRIEVVRGQGATLYGSDALGGVINILTPMPTFSAAGSNIDVSAKTRYVSHGMEKTGRLDFNLATPSLGMTGGVSRRVFGDLHAGGSLGTRSPSGYDEWAGNVKSVIQARENWLVTLAWQYLRQKDVPAFDQVTQRGYMTYFFTPQQRQLSYLQTTAFFSNPWNRKIEATLSWHESTEGREKRKSGSSRLQNERDRVRTWGVQVQSYAAPTPNWQMITGGELYRDVVNSRAEESDLSGENLVKKRGLYPDGSRSVNAAMFNTHSIDFKRARIHAGLRYNMVDITTQDVIFGDIHISPAAFAGHVSILYRMTPQQHLVCNVNRGFRAPNINDLSSFGSFDYGIEVPAPNLNPEAGYTWEAGLKSRTERLAAAVFLYQSWLRDLITRVEASYLGSSFFNGERVYQKANRQAAFIRGIEAEAQCLFGGQWHVGMNLCYAFGQNTTDREPLRRVPPLNGRLTISRPIRSQLMLTAEWLFAAKQDRLSAGDRADHRIPPGGTPGWQIVNFQLFWETRFFSLSSGIYNLFDKAYRPHGSGIEGIGRSFWIGISVEP